MTATGSGLTNLEGHAEFDIIWPWTRPGGLRPGATAVLRVKDEAPPLPFVLPPLLRACDHVLVVDNGSTDGTPEVAREAAERAGLGAQADARRPTPSTWRAPAPSTSPVHERSVHSLSYFYNWCFAQVQHPLLLEVGRRHGADHRGRGSIADLGWQVGDVQSIIRVPRHGLYLESDSKGYLDLGLRNAEEWGFPIGPDFVFTKAFEWEIRTTPDPVRSIGLPHGLCVELKYLDGDEFAHWTDPDVLRDQLPQQAQAPRVDGLQRAAARATVLRRASTRSPRRPGCTSSTTSPMSGCRSPRVPSRSASPS